MSQKPSVGRIVHACVAVGDGRQVCPAIILSVEKGSAGSQALYADLTVFLQDGTTKFMPHARLAENENERQWGGSWWWPDRT